MSTVIAWIAGFSGLWLLFSIAQGITNVERELTRIRVAIERMYGEHDT
jgi:hypothetical protein